jgi:hypothetical protein
MVGTAQERLCPHYELQRERARAECGADHLGVHQREAPNRLPFIEGKGLALELCFSIRVGCPEVPAQEQILEVCGG